MCLTAGGGFGKPFFGGEQTLSPLSPGAHPLPLSQPAQGGGGPPPRRASLFPKILFFPLIFHPFPRHRAGCGGVLVLGQVAEKPKSY